MPPVPPFKEALSWLIDWFRPISQWPFLSIIWDKNDFFHFYLFLKGQFRFTKNSENTRKHIKNTEKTEKLKTMGTLKSLCARTHARVTHTLKTPKTVWTHWQTLNTKKTLKTLNTLKTHWKPVVHSGCWRGRGEKILRGPAVGGGAPACRKATWGVA